MRVRGFSCDLLTFGVSFGFGFSGKWMPGSLNFFDVELPSAVTHSY
jgi:hypothetical protein